MSLPLLYDMMKSTTEIPPQKMELLMKLLDGVKLAHKYPKLLKHIHSADKAHPMYFGLAVSDGWYPILEDLLEELDYKFPNLEVMQVKEKFGALRVYVNDPDREYDFSDVNYVIDKYAKLSTKTCELCGKPATIKDINGWFTCICDECEEKTDG